MKSILYSLSGLVLLMAVAACQPKKEKAEFTESNADSVRNAVLPALPPASEIAAKIQATGADFHYDFVNDLSRKDHYLQLEKRPQAAANLGVYMADMGYLIAYNKMDSAKLYFKACMQLADYIGMDKQFGKAMELRFGEKIKEDARLKENFDLAFKNATNDATGEEFRKQQAAALTGFYIEGLYINIALVKSYPKDILPDDARNVILTPAIRSVLSQKEGISNLLRYFESFKLSGPAVDVYADLVKLNEKYNAMNMDKLLKENNPGLVLKDKMLDGIETDVTSIRNRIVSL